MALSTQFTQLAEADRVALLDVAANGTLRQMLVLEVAQLERQMANLLPPAHTDEAVQFLTTYRQLQIERNILRDLVQGFQHIMSHFNTGE